MRLNKQIFGWLGASALLLTACNANDSLTPAPEEYNASEVYGNGSQIVTLTLNTQDVALGTRADIAGSLPQDATVESPFSHISDGNKANALLFAVYEITNYSDAADESEYLYELAPEFKKEDVTFGTVKTGTGQNLIKVSEENNWPIKIQLALNPDKYYKVAFWAQNNLCSAFTTSDLTNVQVSYDNALNNDDNRDAFCAVSKVITIGSTGEQTEVVLRRPFAQINVGTSGADYKNILMGPKMNPNKRIKYTYATITGVSSKIDVLKDEIGEADDATAVTFAWNKIPAYYNLYFPADADLYKAADYEEFLKVKLNKDPEDAVPSELRGYITSYPTMVKNEDGSVKYYKTETFKYLSMCYVLVPTAPADAENGTTVKVKVGFAENQDGTDNLFDRDDKGNVVTKNLNNYLEIAYVPVQRNWRTNILGGLAFIKDPTGPDSDPDPDDPEDPDPDPEDGPDDPTSIIRTTMLCVHLDPLFLDEYTNIWDQTQESGTAWTKWMEGNWPKMDSDGNGPWHDDFTQKGHETEEEVEPEP